MSNERTFTLDLGGEDYADRVYGCWQGKNAGGTLGTPLEEAWGQEEPFDVWWYPELQEGGLPNDDLEMQLVWLKAAEECGPGITARDLSRYWLDHIGYNWDEYGLSKRNLRLGLEPPVSGNFNNWFIDCMGSPIRSEVWACLAPGAPRVAAHYAFQDAICDHAGGEGVFGELFNASLESAAFVVQDPETLIDIALSYIPEDCQTRRAVEAARAAHNAGLDWKDARKKVLEATPHYVAQYSPINAGFQVIGLLYGTDFGDGICKTVNCGYDTDSSGAAIGSYFGIILGSSGLPEKWVAPLGKGISTNESWGGVRHLTDVANPVPENLDELLARIRSMAKRILRYHGLIEDSKLTVRLEDLYADESIRKLHSYDPNAVSFPGDDVDVTVTYVDGPACFPEQSKQIVATIQNNRADAIQLAAALRVPIGWKSPEPQQVELASNESKSVSWTVEVPGQAAISHANHLWLEIVPSGLPVPPAAPIVLAGPVASRLSQVFPYQGADPAEALDAAFGPETAQGPLTAKDARPGSWKDVFSAGYAQPVGWALDKAGVIYLQTFIFSPEDKDTWLVVDPNCPVRCWLNGELASENLEYRRIRPSQNGLGVDVKLKAGWNELLVKLAYDGAHPTPELHLAAVESGRLNAHLYDVERSRFPWSDTN